MSRISELKALDLASRGLRQLINKMDPSGILVWREGGLAESSDILGKQFSGVCRNLEYDPCLGLDETRIVRPDRLPPTSSTSGWEIRAASISNGDTQIPPTLSMSSLRPQ